MRDSPFLGATYLKGGGIRELKPEIELGISQFLNFHYPSKFWLFNKLPRKSSRFDALQKCVPFWQFDHFIVH